MVSATENYMAEPPKPPVSFNDLFALLQRQEPQGRAPQDKVEAWLRPRAKDWPPICSVCGLQTWNVLPDIIYAPIWSLPPNYSQAPYTYPAVVLSCGYCGHMLFFNAVLMGLVPPAGRK